MGQVYAILLWDSWGSGLVRVNPRLHTDGVDQYDNPCNSWAFSGTGLTAERALRDRGLLKEGEELDKYGRLKNGPMFEMLDMV